MSSTNSVFYQPTYKDPPTGLRNVLTVLIILIVVAIIVVLAVYILTRQRIVTNTTTGNPCNNDSDCTSSQTCVSGNCVTCSIPDIPTGVMISNLQTGIIGVQWNPVSNADSYEIRLGLLPEFDELQALDIKFATGTSQTFEGLGVNTNYYAYVIARNACGRSQKSQTVNVVLVYVFPPKFKLRSLQAQNQGFSLGYQTPAIPGRPILLQGDNMILTHSASTQEIRLFDDPTLCLASNGVGLNAEVRLETCATTPPAEKQWTYSNNQGDPVLCLFSNGYCIGQSTLPMCEPVPGFGFFPCGFGGGACSSSAGCHIYTEDVATYTMTGPGDYFHYQVVPVP